ncbi:peptide cleavage/export ABC transporter [Lactococcus lactis]|uniref:peptide cleavage/export ABC transporter n=1 Tax=Lactococcus lactis TaxID=1358 RepID=UPI0020272CB2|nr:peptide cleavage/export ABC transporter [Lactococcus lactis]MCL9638852.1 peptide cleavage/export ABC transporter [Lactococcus lactis]
MKFKKKYYTPQVDERDCGVAALSMVLKLYGSEHSLASLRIAARTDMEGTAALGIKRAAEQLDFNVQALQADMTLFDMSDVPYPCITHVIKAQKYPHYYVVTGADEKFIHVADPDPTIKLTKITREQFASEWMGISLFISPNPSYRPVKEKTGNLFSFVPVLTRQKKLIANIVIAALLVTIINIIGSYYLQNIIDDYIPNALMTTLGIISVALMITYIIQQMLSFAQTFLLNVLGQRLAIDVILSYIRHIFELPMSFFATRRTGEITSRFSDANSILDALASTIISLFLDVTIVLLTGVVLGLQNLQLFLLVLVSIPIYVIIILVFVRLFEKQNQETMQANAVMSSSIIEDINGIETIKALGSEEKRYQKIDREFADFLKKSFVRQKSEALQVAFKTGTQLLLNVCVLWLGAQLVMHQKITLGQLVTFNALLTYFTNPLTNIINLQTKLQSARVANNRLNEVYLVESEFAGEKAELSVPNIEIEFNHVSYKYGFGHNTLTDINLMIHENEKLTIVGMSGSGKSTLVKLITNFFEPNEGTITLGRLDIKNFDKHQLRGIVNYLPQQPYIFTGTIMENLLLGASPMVSQEEITRAVELTEIKTDIEQMQLGYQTELSSDATSISGGQKQRLAIARTLLSPAKVLILDEATSNLDMITEKKILQNLFQLDKTIIFIAHRLSVAQKSERIIVIDNGQVIEQGSHENLLAANGFYAKLYQS